MSNSDNIEERLIPYIEGVLNEREQDEVDEAIQADAALAREVEELKGVIGELRKGFASGMQSDFPELTVEEIVAMAAHDGNLETMTGSAEQKSLAPIEWQKMCSLRMPACARDSIMDASASWVASPTGLRPSATATVDRKENLDAPHGHAKTKGLT